MITQIEESDVGLKVKTLSGPEVELKQDILDAWRARLRGHVLVAGDSGYDDSRTVWNAMIDRKPAMVARCLGVADVIACVEFARANDLLLAIKGGGHNIAGLATADGALMLDPDRQVQHCLKWLFATFARARSLCSCAGVK